VDERCNLIKKLVERAEIVNPPQRLKIISEDDADNRVLECALAHSADYIISGDFHLLNLGDYKGIDILSPDEFLNLEHKCP
ncbi:MAG: putative toxin-antitoxin system toxin component, PIN family, partial [Candidatus Subteraquimicrobiales bacterium]|nr:putative toxin-antitoxin system toxin component, PIN family [Candidatus Subteraquimicrobiales bacterium]